MKKLYLIIIGLLFSSVIYSQTGRIDLKYPVVVPSLRVGGTTKVRLDSITQNVDTIKFYNGGSELVTNGAGIWTGTGVRLDTTLARITLGINNVTNESKATMFDNSSFTGSARFNGGVYPGLTDITKQIGTVGSEWNRFYMGQNGFITWDNQIFMQETTGQLNLSGGDFAINRSLYVNNNVYVNDSLGTIKNRVNYAYIDTLNANYATITLAGFAPIDNPSFTGIVYVPGLWPIDSGMVDLGVNSRPFRNIYLTDPGNITFGTGSSITASDSVLLLHAGKRIMFTAPLETPMLNSPSINGIIYPSVEGSATLGHINYPWAQLYLDTLSAINWGASYARLVDSNGSLFLENAPLIIDNNDLGSTSYKVKKGWFTDIESTNRPTIGSSTVATTEDINDSIDYYISNATVGIALADSNIYNGGYATRTFVESLLGSGSGMITQRLPFIIGTTSGAPAASDSTVSHTSFSGKHINLYRAGALQYQNNTATNTVDGFRISSDVITVNPVWQAGEQVIVDISEPVFWNSIGFEGEESTLLTGLSGYWKMDETSGTTATDATGTQDAVYLGSIPSVPARIGYGRHTTAATQLMRVPYNTDISPKGEAFTIGFWVYLDSLPSATGRDGYLTVVLNSGSPSSVHEIYIPYSGVNANKLTFYSRNASGTGYTAISTSTISDSTWYHVVCVNRGAGQTMQIYINGSDATGTSGTFTGDVYEGTERIGFGNGYYGLSNFVPNIMDECAIWSKALSGSEITEWYNGGLGSTYPFN